MLNYIEIMGNLITDPDYHDDDENEDITPFCTFEIECEQENIEADGEKENAYFSCVAYNDMASLICSNYIKDMPILISGRLYMRTQEEYDVCYTSTEIMVEDASHVGVDRRERNVNGEPIKKTQKEKRMKRRAAGELMREQFGAPGWNDLFEDGELDGIPYRYQLKIRGLKEWYEKKGIPDPFSLVSDDEIVNLTIEELHEVLSERTGEWFTKASEDQMKITEKNLGRYFFEQRIIPEQLFSGAGKMFIATLATKLGARELYSQLVIRENLRIGGGYKCPYSPEQFIIKTNRMRTSDNKQEFGMVIIEMPEPESVPLCSFLIICHDARIGRIQYYTVEKALGKEHFMLCGVDEDGSHVNYGDAPETFEGVVNKVRDLYSSYLIA